MSKEAGHEQGQAEEHRGPWTRHAEEHRGPGTLRGGPGSSPGDVREDAALGPPGLAQALAQKLEEAVVAKGQRLTPDEVAEIRLTHMREAPDCPICPFITKTVEEAQQQVAEAELAARSPRPPGQGRDRE